MERLVKSSTVGTGTSAGAGVTSSSVSGSTGGKSTQELEGELRDQLRNEIELRSKACQNATYECSLPRVDGHDYCMRHILREPINFKQCMYMYANGRKCLNPVPKHDIKKDPALTTLCFEHNRQLQLRKTHTTIGTFRRAETNEALLHSLSHHINAIEPPKKEHIYGQEEEIEVVSPQIEPYINYEQIHDLGTVAAAIRKRRRILDYASDSSDSDERYNSLIVASRIPEGGPTDNEDFTYDPLKHASTYTRDEIVRITESKLIRLQALYVDQIERLHHILRERRRRYVQSGRKEREYHCSIHDQEKETSRERMLYEQLKALNKYHRRYGVDAVLYKKFKEKRSRAIENGDQKGPSVIKCIFTEGGVKCGERALPRCRHCRKHILEDRKQVLFRACGVEKSGVICQEPIPCICDDATCVLHLVTPARRLYYQKKDESETEEEDGMDSHTEGKQTPVQEQQLP